MSTQGLGTNGDDEEILPLTLDSRVGRLEKQMKEDRHMMYGYWVQTNNGPERVPGLLEQMRDTMRVVGETLEEIKKRDAEWGKIAKFFKRLGWIVGTPIAIVIAIAAFAALVHWLASLNYLPHTL